MLSPDVLMEILRYSQVYNIGIEITRVVGPRITLQNTKSKIKEKEDLKKAKLCYCTGWEQS